MKRWILALVMLGLSVVPALAETAVTTGMGYKKMLSELCAVQQESGKQLPRCLAHHRAVAGPVQGRKRGFRIRFGQADPGGLGRLFRFVSAFGHRRACAGVEKGLVLGIAAGPQNRKSQSSAIPTRRAPFTGKAAERFLTQSGLRGPRRTSCGCFPPCRRCFLSTTGELDAGFRQYDTAVVKAQECKSIRALGISPVTIPSKWSRLGGQRRGRTPKSRRFDVPQSTRPDPFTPSTGCVHNREPTCSANCCTTRKYCISVWLTLKVAAVACTSSRRFRWLWARSPESAVSPDAQFCL